MFPPLTTLGDYYCYAHDAHFPSVNFQTGPEPTLQRSSFSDATHPQGHSFRYRCSFPVRGACSLAPNNTTASMSGQGRFEMNMLRRVHSGKIHLNCHGHLRREQSDLDRIEKCCTNNVSLRKWLPHENDQVSYDFNTVSSRSVRENQLPRFQYRSELRLFSGKF